MNYKSSSFYSTFLKGAQPVRRQFLMMFTFAFILLGFTNPGYSKHPPAKEKKWVGAWGTARQLVEPANMPPAPGLTNNTLRQVVCVTIGGKSLRLKFSNEFSKSPVTMKSVQIAVSKGGSDIDASTTKTLKFDGKDEVTMDAGGEVYSDAVSFKLEPRMLVAITIAYGETSTTVTGHPGSRTTSYIIPGNNNLPDADYSNAIKAEHWYNIVGIEVESNKAGEAAIAVLGDSITDGRGSGTNKQNRWPDMLSLSLLNDPKTKNIGVLNMGIGGNTILRGGLGPTAINRFKHDILQQNGVKWLIIFEGTNDIGGTARRDSTAAGKVAVDIIAALEQMIIDAHAKGMKVYGATITPFKKNGYYSLSSDAARNKVNEFIRTSKHFDGVIDFDKMTRDPADPATMADAFVPGTNANDHLHLNELGYKTMGEGIDHSLFK